MAFGVDDAAAIATAASAVASGVSAATQGVRNKKSYKYTKKLQDAQNAYNTEQAQVAYARQREFYDYMYDKNSPYSQMQQLKKAGLNPNLAYGQLGDGTSAPSVPQASAAGAGQFQIDNSGFAALPASLSQFASLIQSFKMTDAQVNNLNANTEKVGHDIKKVDSEKENIDANTKLTEKQAKKVDIETENLVENLFQILPKQAEKLKAEILKLKSDMDNSQQITLGQVELFKQQVSNLISQSKLNKANMRQLGQVISRYNDIIDSQTGLSSAQAESVSQDAEFKSMIQEYRRQLFDKLKKTPASNDFFGKGSVVGELMILYLLKNLE